MKNFLNKNYNFLNKNVLITGGLGKLGLNICKIFYGAGSNLIITDKISNKSILKKKLSFFKKKNKITFYNCNLASAEEKKNLFKNIKKKFNKIDILINNAALTGDRFEKLEVNFEKQNSAIWSRELEVNLIASIEIVQNLKKLILNSKNPSIINLSSIYGFSAPNFNIYKNTNLRNQIGYSVSKAGIIQFTKWFASYLAPKARVNCISPGGIIRNQSKKFVKAYNKITLLNRMATEEDIISGILFLSVHPIACDIISYAFCDSIAT